ncbi:MAG: hypothetical protein KF824_11465 [Fimbriimonadaceae bacterium]|nr:MAG: hypothetical protein KF824_11465 [Fimbriimonadaceae bacterium]
MISAVLILSTPVQSSRLQAVEIWQRAREAHGINFKTHLPSLGWEESGNPILDHKLAKSSRYFAFLDCASMAIDAPEGFYFVGEYAAELCTDKVTPLTKEETIEFRSQFLRHPYGILNIPGAAVVEPNGLNSFVTQIKGLRTVVNLDTQTNRIKSIEYQKLIDGRKYQVIREFQYSNITIARFQEVDERDQFWMPTSWSDTLNGVPTKIVTYPCYHFGYSCWGTSPWIPEGYSINP